MRDPTLRTGNVAAAAVLIGGVLLVALPRRAVSIVQVVAVTVAVAAVLHALATHVPVSGWLSPFRWMSPFHRPSSAGARGPDELDSIRARVSGRRQRLRGGPPLPPETLRLLQPLIRAALDLDRDDASYPPSARTRLSPVTWAVLTTDPLRNPYWFRTLPANDREVAGIVHAVLDDLERLAPGISASQGLPHPNPTRSP